MLTLLLYTLLALVAVGCLYGIATLFLSRTEQISAPARDQAPWRLADAPLAAQDVVEMRLPIALRGYRFAETDLLLDRLADELKSRDDEIARLKAGGREPSADTDSAPAAASVEGANGTQAVEAASPGELGYPRPRAPHPSDW